MSWKRKDWLKFAGLLGLGATGLGAAGIGPMAGLLGGAEAGALGAGDVLGAGSPAFGLDAVDPVARSTGLLGNLSGMDWEKGAKGLQLANQFTQQGQPQPVQQQTVRPQAPQITGSADVERLKKLYAQIYGGLYV